MRSTVSSTPRRSPRVNVIARRARHSQRASASKRHHSHALGPIGYPSPGASAIWLSSAGVRRLAHIGAQRGHVGMLRDVADSR